MSLLQKKAMTTIVAFFDGFVAKKVMTIMSLSFSMVVVL